MGDFDSDGQKRYTAETAPKQFSFRHQTCALCGCEECVKSEVSAGVGNRQSGEASGMVCANCGAGMAVRLKDRHMD
jgi:transcription elongation factor Elf1